MARLPITPAVPMGPQLEAGWNGIEASAQSWKIGAPLIGSSGKLAEASANPRTFLGFAADAASGTADTGVRYYPALPFTVYEGTLDKASGLGTRALAQSDVFAEYGLTRDASGIWYVDIDKTTGGTNTMVLVVGLVDKVGAIQGDTPGPNNSGNARVLFVVLNEVYMGHVGP